ncbi:MAG TPA: MAPEG family protein [Sphingomicrobium sp.]|nr:MAPEG family protein [Sphingomicrobium sp.]
MHPSPLLGPVVALVAWSIVMFFWLAIARAPQLRGRKVPEGTRGADLEREQPGRSQWLAHNYQHLMEQPTVFYAIVFALILMGFDAPINVYLAWGYVGFRILHSLWQATINIVPVRFLLILAATLCLIALTIHAAIFLLRHG